MIPLPKNHKIVTIYPFVLT